MLHGVYHLQISELFAAQMNINIFILEISEPYIRTTQHLADGVRETRHSYMKSTQFSFLPALILPLYISSIQHFFPKRLDRGKQFYI